MAEFPRALDSEPPSRGLKSQEPAMREQAAALPLSQEGFAPRRRSDGGRVLTDSRGTGIVLGELSATDRPRIAEILRGSRVFSREEMGVALDLFDESLRDCGLRIADELHHLQSEIRSPQSDYL